MARVNASEYAEKWGRRTKVATEDYRKGVERVSQAPGEKAAAQAALFAQKVAEAVASGKWQRSVAGVSLQDWKTAALQKGAGRIAAGVDGASKKQVAMAEKLLANVDRAVAAANQTPRGSIEDNINRMVTFARTMHDNPVK